MIIPVQPGQLANGFCPASYQDMVNGFSAVQTVTIPDNTSISVSATKPADKTKPWLQLDQFGRPIRLYWFAQGSWLSYHTITSGMTIWWFDVLPNFTTFDGGDANALTVLSGPMWQQAKNSNGLLISAMFPIPAGTLPSTTVLAQGATGGEEKHVLTLPEIPSHTHPTPRGDGFVVWDKISGGTQNWTGGPYEFDLPSASGETPSAAVTGASGGNGATTDGHNTMPPYIVGYLLQRTTRIYYSVT